MLTTFYLKYRPKNFSELDNVEAREALEKIFKSGKFPHAFLFSGPKGIGKTSAARIVAKAVNCLSKVQSSKCKVQSESGSLSDYEPCNQCDACISINKQAAVDVLEIDAASNRGIDDIKELREKIKLAPAVLKHKVYIIDEVHMLTTEAFNALLKTLEEPPEHAVFVLCTTDPEKLPKTITSRCQIINFKKATLKEISERLKKICELEKIDFEEKALMQIARLSDGGFRDAVKTLEQVSYSGIITEEEVRKVAGVLAEFKPINLLALLEKRQVKEALEWIGKAAESGANLRVLTENLLDDLRVLLLFSFGVEEEDKPEESLTFSVPEIRLLIDLFSKAYFELKSAVIPQLPLEIAVVEWSEQEFKVQPASPVGGSSKCKVDGGSNVVIDKTKDSEKEKNPEDFSKTTVQNITSIPNFSLEVVLQKWPEILEKVKPLNHSVLAFLKATRPVSFVDGYLILEVFYKFHKDQLEKDQSRKIFEKSAGEVLGCEIKLKCNLSENRPQTTKPIPTFEEFQPPVIQPQKNTGDDIIRIAEEIFNKSGVQ